MLAGRLSSPVVRLRSVPLPHAAPSCSAARHATLSAADGGGSVSPAAPCGAKVAALCPQPNRPTFLALHLLNAADGGGSVPPAAQRGVGCRPGRGLSVHAALPRQVERHGHKGDALMWKVCEDGKGHSSGTERRRQKRVRLSTCWETQMGIGSHSRAFASPVHRCCAATGLPIPRSGQRRPRRPLSASWCFSAALRW